MIPTDSNAWKQLQELALSPQRPQLEMLVGDSSRNNTLSHNLAGCQFDFSRQSIDESTLSLLQQLAEDMGIAERRDAMFSGQTINQSEKRAVLHTSLRSGDDRAGVGDAVSAVQQDMFTIVQDIRQGKWLGYSGKPILDVVHIGIGGSHLGPELVVRALAEHSTTHINIHFIVNVDAHDIQSALAALNPETTLFIIASKSFSTLETQINAQSARSWFLERTGSLEGLAQHFIAVTNNIAAAAEFGLPEENLLPMWDWVGGRFSLWSAVGLPILISLGQEKYIEFLDGAKQADEHFLNNPFKANIPMLSAACALWNINFLNARSLATLCYDERLKLLPDFLQQLEMESNGKSTDNDGNAVNYHTMPVLWGGTGTRGQHAYHQQLHQGTFDFCADIIVVAKASNTHQNHHDWLLANAVAQGQAFAQGNIDLQNQHRHVAGNRPTTTITLDSLEPGQLGTLLALYEHKVFCLGIYWNINSFDQWGVELGKQLALPVYEALTDSPKEQKLDAATSQLIQHIKTSHNPL